jgi:hypothetical protein
LLWQADPGPTAASGDDQLSIVGKHRQTGRDHAAVLVREKRGRYGCVLWLGTVKDRNFFALCGFKTSVPRKFCESQVVQNLNDEMALSSKNSTIGKLHMSSTAEFKHRLEYRCDSCLKHPVAIHVWIQHGYRCDSCLNTFWVPLRFVLEYHPKAHPLE